MVKQERARRTRERVLDAAAHEFAAHGYAHTTINGVAARLGMTKGALYGHFASKDLLAAALLRYGEETWTRIHSPAPVAGSASPPAPPSGTGAPGAGAPGAGAHGSEVPGAGSSVAPPAPPGGEGPLDLLGALVLALARGLAADARFRAAYRLAADGLLSGESEGNLLLGIQRHMRRLVDEANGAGTITLHCSPAVIAEVLLALVAAVRSATLSVAELDAVDWLETVWRVVRVVLSEGRSPGAPGTAPETPLLDSF
ncbi:TetR family transcriptional regulator [Streptomyces filamentosus]|uniref:TetR family transcriptional regulator n=1 Tax=Streptomyces filamentosus TaxID=67294 RepID=UPI00381F0640